MDAVSRAASGDGEGDWEGEDEPDGLKMDLRIDSIAVDCPVSAKIKQGKGSGTEARNVDRR